MTTLTLDPRIDYGALSDFYLMNGGDYLYEWGGHNETPLFKSRVHEIPRGINIVVDNRLKGTQFDVSGAYVGSGDTVADQLSDMHDFIATLRGALAGRVTDNQFDWYPYDEQYYKFCTASAVKINHPDPLVPVCFYSFTVISNDPNTYTSSGGGVPADMAVSNTESKPFGFAKVAETSTSSTELKFVNRSGREQEITSLQITGCNGALAGSGSTLIRVADFAVGGSGNSIATTITYAQRSGNTSGSLTWANGATIYVRVETATAQHVDIEGHFTVEG